MPACVRPPARVGTSWRVSGYFRSMRDALRRDLVAAMRSRDAIAVSALRSAIAALDNAEAVAVDTTTATPSSRVAGAVVGLGATEAPRRELSPADVAAVLRREIAERIDAAEEATRLGQPDHAKRFRAEAHVLQRYVSPAPAG